MAHLLLVLLVSESVFGKLTMFTSLERFGPEEMKSAGEHPSLNTPPQMRTNFRYVGMQMAKSLPMG
jgi:hypothetical protein